MVNAETKNEKLNINEIIIDIIQKKRKVFITMGIVIAVAIVGFAVGVSIADALEAKAISRVEAFDERYEALRFNINEPAQEEEVNALTDEVSSYASGASEYSGVRAYMLTASIHADRKNWKEAEAAWVQAAKKGGKSSYLVPVSLFNAAVAAEEGGDTEGAISHYTETLVYADSFPQAARAQFAIGRLQEEQQNREAAVEAYRELIAKWPAETIWINLANSRIIVLSGLNP
jgi:tetratricopeptide (TPR) repeat protein